MAGSIPDLGKARGDDPRARPEAPGPVTPVYVNDVQPTVETDGTVTLVMAYQGSGGMGESHAFTMPAGLFLELCTRGVKIAADAAAHGQAHGERVQSYLEGVAARKAAEPEAQRRGGPPVPIQGAGPGGGQVA